MVTTAARLFYAHVGVMALLTVTTFSAQPAAAQNSRGIIAGAGGGGTYYCIVSRCGTGSLIGATVGIEAARALVLEAGARRHFCTDCGQFVIGEVALLLQYPRSSVMPFVAVGLSHSSDADFMGRHAGILAGAGTYIRVREPWRIRIEVRGRQVGRGDSMGDLSLSLARRFGAQE